jgi:hypothetical protein
MEGEAQEPLPLLQVLLFLEGTLVLEGGTADIIVSVCRSYYKRVQNINTLEPGLASMSDAELQAKTLEFKARHADGVKLDDMLPEAFAVVREASKRVLSLRHYDVQLVCYPVRPMHNTPGRGRRGHRVQSGACTVCALFLRPCVSHVQNQGMVPPHQSFYLELLCASSQGGGGVWEFQLSLCLVLGGPSRSPVSPALGMKHLGAQFGLTLMSTSLGSD